MKAFEAIVLDAGQLSKELDELEAFLNGQKSLQERKHVAPFFKSRKHLCAALGSLGNPHIHYADRVASELSLFGDFACDATSGDSETNAYTLIEFEDALENSIFSKCPPGKSMKGWAPRFEHGFSQLVDWAWRLSSEVNTPGYRRIFGSNEASIHLLLVAGREADLSDDDQTRLLWRAANISLGAYRMSCLTFDGVLTTLRRRLKLVQQVPHPACI